MCLALAGALLPALAGCSVQPEPFTAAELAEYAIDKRTRVIANQEPLNGLLTLDAAIARALKYNLDNQVETMQTALVEKQLRVSQYSELPDIVAGSNFNDRNNYSGGSSVQLLGPNRTGAESLTPSTSSERDVRSTDIRISWNILDFGLSYVRAKQGADKVLIGAENRRRVTVRIMENVRTAYWRAVAATRMLDRLSALESRVEQALADTDQLARNGKSSPLTALTSERELIEIQRTIRDLESDLSGANAQLAALINADPGNEIAVFVPDRLLLPSLPRMPAEEMISIALTNRSELREVAYQQRVNAKEAEAAILEMLPGISLDAGVDWNSNRFLFNNNWVSWAAQASWNLIQLYSYPDRRSMIESQDELLDARALAVTMAIMTQVHVSRARIYHSVRSFQIAEHYLDVQSRISRQINAAMAAGTVSEQIAIREEMNTLVAIVRRDLDYAEVQGAVASLKASLGLTPSGSFYDPDLGTTSNMAALVSGMTAGVE